MKVKSAALISVCTCLFQNGSQCVILINVNASTAASVTTVVKQEETELFYWYEFEICTGLWHINQWKADLINASK